MKKFFTLIAAMMLSVCMNVNAGEKDFDLNPSNWGWGWGTAPAELADGILTINFGGGYAAFSTGYDPAVDWSEWTSLVFVIDSYDGDYGKVLYKFSDNAGENVIKEFGAITEQTEIVLPIDATANEWVKTVKQVAIQGGNTAATMKVSRVYLANDKVIDNSVIWKGSANQGTGWSWDATVGLTGADFANLKSGDALTLEYTINGEAEYHQFKALFGQWGNQEHKMPASLAAVVNEYDCAALEDGTTSYEIALTDDDIATLKAEGLRLSGFDVTFTKLAIKSTTGINAIKTAKPAQSNVIYNLAGQKVGADYKGVVIKNGKKFFQK